MTRLVEAMQELGVEGEVELSGQWASIRGERCIVYVVENERGEWYSWCDIPEEQTVRRYLDPVEAIREGLERAGGPGNDFRGHRARSYRGGGC